MATQDNSPGLLSKVARFVRNPTKDWADLDKPEVVKDSENGKEALKQMIERKRHNDSVRKREFSQLRKLRQASPAAKAELVQNVSSFRTSSGDVDADTDERATTLKKIDEIEAQMSRQWWRGRSGAASGVAAGADDSPPLARPDATRLPDGPEGFPATEPSQLSSTVDGAPTQLLSSVGSDFLPTKLGVAPATSSVSGFDVSARSVFSPSKMVSLDMGQNLSDPELEEAAIRYANGDDAGAEAALKAALQSADASPETTNGWAAALFDLYRSTGQQASFERMALEYAQRFGRSAPAWSSPPRQAGGYRAVTPLAPVAWPAASVVLQWDSPVEMDDADVVHLRAQVHSGAVIYSLNWGPVRRISASAAQSLAELFARWCDMPLALNFEGVPSLEKLLRVHTPNGDRSVPPHFWRLRLDALRLLGLQDDYELAALEFCVTFEMSPPPWRKPLCQRVNGPQTNASGLPARSESALLENTWPVPFVDPVEQESDRQLVLSGEVAGDVSDIVTRWQKTGGEGGLWVVSCTQLVRVDFSAAGGLLNWVARVQTEGGRVEFRDVPRLVAAFFNLIGINEHAQVTARIN